MSTLFWVWLGGAFAVAAQSISSEERKRTAYLFRMARQASPMPRLSFLGAVTGSLARVALWPLTPLMSSIADRLAPWADRRLGIEHLPLRCDGCGHTEPGELVLGRWVRLPDGWLSTEEGSLACGLPCVRYREQAYALGSPEVQKILYKRCRYTVQPGDDLRELLRVSKTTLKEVEDLNGGSVEWVVGKEVILPEKTCHYLEQNQKRKEPMPEKYFSAALVEACARAAHEVNRAYCAALGDFTQASWEEAPEWQKESERKGAHFHLSGEHGPAASHVAWLEEKRATGWKYGPVKDSEKKEHPCFVSFEELPREQRAKDYLFTAVVRATRETWKASQQAALT